MDKLDQQLHNATTKTLANITDRVRREMDAHPFPSTHAYTNAVAEAVADECGTGVTKAVLLYLVAVDTGQAQEDAGAVGMFTRGLRNGIDRVATAQVEALAAKYGTKFIASHIGKGRTTRIDWHVDADDTGDNRDMDLFVRAAELSSRRTARAATEYLADLLEARMTWEEYDAFLATVRTGTPELPEHGNARFRDALVAALTEQGLI